MAENHEPGKWDAVVCSGFAAVNVLSSTNVEELGWDYTEMELDPTGTCGLFDGMLLDWDDDTPEERREHEEFFPDAFTVGARILADDWDHEIGNDEVRSRCFLIIEDADQFTDHDTGRDWLCESTMADFSEAEAMTFFQNLTLVDSQDIAELGGRPIIPSAGPEECRAAVLAFNQKMVARRRERGLDDMAEPASVKKTVAAPKPVMPKMEQVVHGLGKVDFSGLGYGWGAQYPDSLSVDGIGIDYPSGEHNDILNFSPITHAVDVVGRKFFCHETTLRYDCNADSWSGATIGPDFWTFDGEEAREFAENIGFDLLAARACGNLGIDAPGLKGREALPIPKAVDVAPEPGAQAEAAKAAAAKKVSGEGGGVRTSASTGVERGGLHFYFGDEPKPAPEFFRERHSKTRPIVCLETGESFMGNPAAARPLHVSPAAISQAVRYGSPVNGLHFYHGDEPKPAPEFFKPAKGKGGKSPAAIAAAAKAAAGNSAPGTDYREHGIQRDRRAVQ